MPLIGFAAMALASASPPIVADFAKLCEAPASSAQAILAQADRDGWRKSETGGSGRGASAAERFKDSDQGELKLVAEDTESAGERREVCGISTAAKVPDLVAATTAQLGFAPALNLGTAATFFAVRSGESLQSGAGLSQPAFLAAKAQGRFYSIMASTDDMGVRLFALHVMAPG